MVVIGQEKKHGMCHQRASAPMQRKQLTGHPGEAKAEWQAHVSVECIDTIQHGAVVPGSTQVQAFLSKPKLKDEMTWLHTAGVALSRRGEFECDLTVIWLVDILQCISICGTCSRGIRVFFFKSLLQFFVACLRCSFHSVWRCYRQEWPYKKEAHKGYEKRRQMLSLIKYERQVVVMTTPCHCC